MANQNDPTYDSREGDPVYHEAPPADSGSASSFDARHNEFTPDEGQSGAGVDARTGETVHGDGQAKEAPADDFPEGRDAEQPDELDDEGRRGLEDAARAQDAPNLEGDGR
jgi:hypothetical protein